MQKCSLFKGQKSKGSVKLLRTFCLLLCSLLCLNGVVKAGDDDADGMDDGWEIRHGLDPVNPNDAMTDLDQDGYTNLGEYLHASDPNDSSAVPMLNVSLAVPANVPTIQAAIDMSIDGDTVEVSPGTYMEDIDFDGHEIQLRSADPNNPNTVASTVIMSNSGYAVVSFRSGESSKTRLEGFTLTGGMNGVSCYGAASPKISKCHIVANQNDGVYIQGSSISTVCIDQCRIIGNGGNDAAGIVCRYGKLILTNSVVANNGASRSTGLYLGHGNAGLSQIVNCTVTGHTYRGIYRYFTGSMPEISNCILWNNGDDLRDCTATYSCIQDGDAGLGNIGVDPGFVDIGSEDYRLSAESLCVDAGAPWTEYVQEPSPNGNRVNMGAHGGTAQAMTSNDSDGDGLSDNWEAFYWPGDDPQMHDPDDDFDQDSFSNQIENLYGYDPTISTNEGFSILHTEVFPETFNPTNDEIVSIRYWSNKNATGHMNLVSSMNPNRIIKAPAFSASAGVNQTQWSGMNNSALIAKRGTYHVDLTLDDGFGHVAANKPVSATVIYDHKIDAIHCNPQRIRPLNNEVMRITYKTAIDKDVVVNIRNSQGELFGAYPVAGSESNELVLHGTSLPVGDPASRYLSNDEDYSVEITYQGMEETKQAVNTRAKREESRNHNLGTIGLSGYMYSDTRSGYHHYARYDLPTRRVVTIGYYGALPIDNPDERPTRPGPSLEQLRERIVIFHNNDPCSIDLAAKEAWLDALESGWLMELYRELGWPPSYTPTAEQCNALAQIMLDQLLPNWEYEEETGWVNRDAMPVDGDPVDLSHGEFVLSVTDLAFSGRVLPVFMIHTYGSQRQYNGPFGYGWDMNYNIKVRRVQDPNVVVYLDGQGNKREYLRSETDPNVLMRKSDLSTTLYDRDGVLTLKTNTGIECLFDPNGNLAQIADKSGNALTFTYDSRGLLPIKGFSGAFHKPAFDGPDNRYGVVAMEYQLTTITDDLGRDTTLSYDANGLLTTLTDFANRTVAYTYDPNTNDLLTVTDPNGHITTYAYGFRHNLTDITDPNGQVYTTNYYDLDGRVVSQVYGEGVFTFDYNYDANEVIVIDREGGIKKTVLNDSGQVLSETIYTSDPDADPNEFTVTHAFNAHSNITRTTLPAGNCVAYEYDALGNITALYQKASVSDPNTATDPNVLATLFTYDPNHVYKAKTITDPEGHVTTFEYDQNGHVVDITYPSVGQQTPVVQYTYNTYGQLDTSTSPDGIVSKHIYYSESSDPNNYGRLWKVVADYGPDPLCQNITTEFEYDGVGNLIQTTDPGGNTSQFVYNEVDQLVKTINAHNHETFLGYNDNKKLAWTRTQINGVDQTTRYTYDLLDHVKTLTGPMGYVAANTYNKNEDPNRLTDPEGNAADIVYNERGLVCKVIDANGGATQYTYENNGNLAQVKDAKGNATLYTYDKFDTLIRTTYEGSTHEEWYYNRNNQVTHHINRAGQTIEYVYDALGRLTVKHRPDDPNILFAYDIAGRLTDVNDGADSIQYTYDRLGRASSVTDLENRTVAYEYNTRGLRTKLTYPGVSTLSEKPQKRDKEKKPKKDNSPKQDKKGEKDKPLHRGKGPDKYERPQKDKKREKDSKPKEHKKPQKQNPNQDDLQTRALSLVYGYDNLGRLQQIITDNNDVLAEYTYDDLSRRTQLTLGNGASVVYAYDLGNRLTTLTNQVSTTDNITFEYADYDKVGNRLSARTNTHPTQVYAYDNRYQLTFVDYNDGNSTTYGYDSVGNRTRVNDGSVTPYFSNTLNQVTAMGSTPLSYDMNGNLTGAGGNTYYDYDCENRLTHVYNQGGDPVASYVYDYCGRRIQKTVYGSPTVITKYAYDGDQVIAEYDDSDSLLRQFVYGPGIDEPICMIDVEHGNTVYYYHLDGLGSVVALSDVNNVIVERYSYSVFGEPNRVSDVNNPYLFTGRRFDAETRLYNYRARYYAYDIGRFLQTDPIGYADGLNWYTYCGNNPVGLVDPFGLCKGGGWWGSIWQGALYGDFAGDTGWSGIGSQIGVGFIPIVGQIADARDTGAALSALWNSPTSGGAWAGLGGALVAWVPGFGDAAKGLFKGGRKAATEATQAAIKNTGTEVVHRWMSKGELANIQSSGKLSRGGRAGDHFVTNSANKNAKRARQRLALGYTPEVRVTLEVPEGAFSGVSKVSPLNGMTGGGLERIAPGHLDVPARILSYE